MDETFKPRNKAAIDIMETFWFFEAQEILLKNLLENFFHQRVTWDLKPSTCVLQIYIKVDEIWKPRNKAAIEVIYS